MNDEICEAKVPVVTQDQRANLGGGEGPNQQKIANWVISMTRGSRLAHRLGQASWNTQLEDWTTLCGWHSARRNTKMSMAVRKPLTIATMANKWSPDPVQMANQTDPELKVNGPSDFANASEAPFGFGGWEGSHPQSGPCSVL